jgi:hypothetical protein
VAFRPAIIDRLVHTQATLTTDRRRASAGAVRVAKLENGKAGLAVDAIAARLATRFTLARMRGCATRRRATTLTIAVADFEYGETRLSVNAVAAALAARFVGAGVVWLRFGSRWWLTDVVSADGCRVEAITHGAAAVRLAVDTRVQLARELDELALVELAVDVDISGTIVARQTADVHRLAIAVRRAGPVLCDEEANRAHGVGTRIVFAELASAGDASCSSRGIFSDRHLRSAAAIGASERWCEHHETDQEEA